MGASFQTAWLPEQNAETAFARLQEQMRYDHGHSGYTGTFAECSGLTIMPTEAFDTEQEAERWLTERAEKWGPAIAVRVNQKPGLLYIGAWCSE